MLALSGVVTALGSVAGFIYLVFIIWCAIVTFRKGQYLLFILGFLCGVCWIIGLFATDKRHVPAGMGDGHYVAPPPGG